MPAVRNGALLLAAILSASRSAALPDKPGDPEDWANSPEAYFLTADERQEWKRVDSRDGRAAFVERYWLKRDPSPGTSKNEFREAVLARIKTADARFPIQKTPGSRTKRGMVFVVFGSPARVQESLPVRPEAPRPPASGVIGAPVGFTEGTESTSVWTYDRERTPLLLEAIGNRPSLEVTFLVDPSRHRDEIQAPGLVEEYREVLARKSIVNPDLIGSPAPPPLPARMAEAPALPRAVLTAQVVKLLETARAAPRGEDGSVFSSAVVWGSGEPTAFVWFYLPEASGKVMLHGRIRDKGGEEVATASEEGAPSPAFSLAAPQGVVLARAFALPPGDYDASFALEGKAVRTAAASSLQVPDLSAGFAVSSLLLAPGPARAEEGSADPFTFGNVRLSPRADATFSKSESLWYFLVVSGMSDPKSVTLETRLRRGAAAPGPAERFAAELVEFAPGRYLTGFELPLTGLPASDYVLYVGVRRAGGEPVLRRGDFRLRD